MAKSDFKDISEIDLAYKILSDAGKNNPIHYKALILDVIEKKNKPVQNQAAAISEIYTMLNMDSRFQYAGEGMWGLVEWNPPETKTRRSSKTATSRTATEKTTTRRKKLEDIQI